MIIYKSTNLVNNKVYIGLTTRSLKQRIREHIRESYTRCLTYFHKAIRKYGPVNFKWEIIRTAETKEQLQQYEIEEIAKHKSNDPEFGYNLTAGGDAITDPDRDYNGKNNPFYGKHHSEETKQKLREINIGKCAGEKNYFYNKHYTSDQNHFFGKHHSDETKSSVGNANSRHFKVTTTDGNSFIIKNLHTFCVDNGLVYHSVKLNSRSHTWYKKQYLFEKVD